MWETLSVIAILISAIALVSSSTLLPNGSSIDVLAAPTNSHINDQTHISPQTLVQNLTKANVPVTLPLTRGYVNGFEVFYISTEASDKGLADHLTNFTHSRVSYTPALRNAPPQSLGNIYVFANGIKGPGPLGFQANVAGAALLSGGSSDLYVFTNGIKGTGPMCFQASIAAANVGDIAYSPLWRIQATTWKDPSHAEFLTSLAQITSAAQAGKISTNIAGVVINCPFVDVHV